MPPLTTILLADDHLPTRGLLQVILEEQGFLVVASVRTADEAVAEALRHRPALCLLDIHMPSGGGLHALAEIRRHLPDTACVMLSASDTDGELFEALRTGAAGYLPKTMDLDRVPDALRGVLRGEAALPRRTMGRVLGELRKQGSGGGRPMDETGDGVAQAPQEPGERRRSGWRRLSRP